ncbi:MAG: SdpI family protein [Emergencia sp.]
MKEYKKTLIFSCLVCLLPLVLSAALFSQLPDRIAIHWDFAGNADGYAGKAMGAFGLPLLLLILQLVVCFGVFSDPKRKNQSAAMRTISIWIIPVLGLVLQPMTLLAALGHDVPITTVVMLIVGVLFIICGNYLPKSRQNYTVGIKLPWTLADADNWNRTHRLAGVLWIIGGILFLIMPFLPAGAGIWILFAVCLTVMILVPVGYSFLLYVRKGGPEL